VRGRYRHHDAGRGGRPAGPGTGGVHGADQDPRVHRPDRAYAGDRQAVAKLTRRRMPIYRAPLDDIRFVLHDLLDAGELAKLPGYEEATPDLIDAILEEGARLAENEIFPLNQSGDEEGCRFE